MTVDIQFWLKHLKVILSGHAPNKVAVLLNLQSKHVPMFAGTFYLP
jgi:hypothetical protein